LTQTYDAVLVVSFGGPEKPDDVLPFLENVLRGRRVPRERMLEVAQHYHQLGGVSPLNEQNRQLIRALQAELAAHGPQLPLYWGNRNWHPLLPDAVQQMADDGVRRALAFVTSAFSSYSGCRQYLEDIRRAREAVGPTAPEVDKLRAFFNHPGFIESMIEQVGDALQKLPADERGAANIVYTAHSIPISMAEGSAYVAQLEEASRLVSERLGISDWSLAFQSRSGPATQPWLEPDVCDCLRALKSEGATAVVVVPLGFLSDHMEVRFDLDTQAKGLCDALGLTFVRVATVGTHPKFVSMIRELIRERLDESLPRRFLGSHGPCHDVCPTDCCPGPTRRTQAESSPQSS